MLTLPLGREQIRGERLRLVKAPFGIANLETVVHYPFIDADREPTGGIDTGPHFVFKGRAARTEVREGDQHSATTFTTLGKIHACRLL